MVHNHSVVNAYLTAREFMINYYLRVSGWPCQSFTAAFSMS